MSDGNINNNTNEDFYEQQNYNPFVCRNCGNPIIEEGYKLNLCKDCRSKLSKRPIPILIKILFFVVLALVIYSLIKFPKTIQGALAYERGKQAEEQKKYVTALNQYQNASEQYNYSGNLKGQIIVAEYYNGDYSNALDHLIELEGVTIENDKLYEELEHISDEIQSFYMFDDELDNLLKQIDNESYEIKTQKLVEYVNTHQNNCIAAYMVADLYCGQGLYEEAKTYMNIMLKQHPNNQIALISMAAIERELENYGSAIKICENMLDINSESAAAYAAYARIELKRFDDKKALKYIEKAYEIDSNNISIMETLAEVYHYNNMINERDNIINIIKNHKDCKQSDIQLLEELQSQQ